MHRNRSKDLSQLGALAHRANLQFRAILLQDALIVVLPEGFGCVLSSEALEDLGASRVLLEEFCKPKVNV